MRLLISGPRVRAPQGILLETHTANFISLLYDYENQMCFDNKNHASLAEWSNATDLSSVSFGSAGSNPAGCILGFHPANNKLSKKVGFRFDSGIGVTQLAQW